MAYSGHVDSNAVVVPGESSSETRYFRFAWTSTHTATSSSSKTTVSWTLTSKGGYTGWVTVHNINLVVNGVTKYTKSSIDLYPNVTVASGSFTLTHSGTSNATFPINLSSFVYYSSGSNYKSSASKTFTVTGNTAPTSSINSTYSKTYGSITITPTISSNGTWATSILDKKVQMYSNGSWTNLGNFTSGSPYIINNLDPSTSYKFRLYVKNDTYKSSYSSALTCTTDAFARPSIPRSVTLSPTSDITPASNYSLSWRKPSTVGDTNDMHYRFRIYAGVTGTVSDTDITAHKTDSAGVVITTNDSPYTISNLNYYMTRNLNAGEYLTVVLFAFKSYNNVNYYTRGASGSSIYVDSAGNCAVLKKVGPCQSGQARMWINTTNGWQNGLVFINDNGTWKPAKAVYVNDNGTWKKGT